MKSWIIDGQFGLSSLRMITRPDPIAGPGEVIVRIKAAALNYRDLMMVKGLYNPRQPLPLVPLSDGAGEIVALGQGVTRWKVGDRVCVAFFQDFVSGELDKTRLKKTMGGPLSGTLSEYVVLSENGLFAAPSHLSDVEAATLPCAGLTAWNAIVHTGKMCPGQTVVVHGTGGVSLFALQFARMLGSQVIVVSGSPAKFERVKALGATHVIDRTAEPKWSKVVHSLTDDCGADVVVELGGASTFEESLAATRACGTVCLIGVLGGNAISLQLTSIFMRNLRLQGIIVGSLAQAEAMSRAVEMHQLKPVVDRVFEAEHITEALAYLESGQHMGKICIQL